MMAGLKQCASYPVRSEVCYHEAEEHQRQLPAFLITELSRNQKVDR